jgi:hypothetical protein
VSHNRCSLRRVLSYPGQNQLNGYASNEGLRKPDYEPRPFGALQILRHDSPGLFRLEFRTLQESVLGCVVMLQEKVIGQLQVAQRAHDR